PPPPASLRRVGELDKRLDITDDQAVLRLGPHRDEVVLPQGDQLTVDGDSCLGRDVVVDSADLAPSDLGPVTAETPTGARVQALVQDGPAAQETTDHLAIDHGFRGGVDEQG